ncbi:phenylacetate--CoA ligase family protein [Thiovibrio sp. JS02]
MISSLVYKFRNRAQMRMLADFSQRQWRSCDLLLVDGDNLARKLAVHAKASVPYYERTFRNMQLDPASMNFPYDWERIPFLSKEILRQENKGLLSTATAKRRRFVNHSGGSTGTPVTFLTDWQQYQRMGAWMAMVFSWAGWRPGELCFELWGNKEKRLPPTLWDRLRASLSGHFAVPVYDYTEKELMLWRQVLVTLKPTIIYGYPSVVADFARWLDAEGHIPEGVKGVFCSAEVLYPEQRHIIENVFRCKVYNQYGSRETPCLACECPEGGMHIFVDFNRVEFIDLEGDPAGSRDIVVTPLYNYVQPLMRYRLGDLGLPRDGQCACGRGYPLMELNIGRSGDMLYGQHGNKIFPSFFIHVLDGNDWIRSFQFIQKALNRLELNIEPEGQDLEKRREALIRAILPKIEEKMGPVELVVNLVEKIDRTKAGKHRFVVNETASKGGDLHASG